jgi:yecA family protein
MLLEELDGFVAGLLVCPELIGEWLPVVWGSEEGDEPAFDSLDHLNRLLGLVMEHYNDVARTLIERSHSYGPLFAVDKRHNEVLWETWIAGFGPPNCGRRLGRNALTAEHKGAGVVRPPHARQCRPPRLALRS